MKVIYVNKGCCYCPLLSRNNANICGIDAKQRVIKNIMEFPAWCGLEDVSTTTAIQNIKSGASSCQNVVRKPVDS